MTDRVRLSLRVPSESLAAYYSAVFDKFGCSSPYLGTELEREMQQWCGIGDVQRLHDNITTLSDRSEHSASKKKTSDAPRGETDMCQYHVSEQTRAEFMATANRDDRSPGTVIGDLMNRYATDGSCINREANRVAQVIDVFTDCDGADGAHKIADRLGTQFLMEDVESAILDAGYETVSYAKQRYLDDVLSITATTWHPNNPELFVPTSSDVIPKSRDKRTMPNVLMSDADKREAIVTELRERVRDNTSDVTTASLKVPEILTVLNADIEPQTAANLLRSVADSRETIGIQTDAKHDWPRLVDKSDEVRAKMDLLEQAERVTDGGAAE